MDALERLHKIGIIHRDLKLENILIDRNGHVVIADLGMAHAFDITSTEPHTASLCCGSFPYYPPEMLKRQPYSYPADIWSLGVVLSEMAFGDIPWDTRRRVEDAPDNIIARVLMLSHSEGVSNEFLDLLFSVIGLMNSSILTFLKRLRRCLEEIQHAV